MRILLLACLVLSPGPLFSLDSIGLDIALQGFETAGPPRFVEDVLVFTYRPEKEEGDRDRPVHFVGIRFAHEGYSVLHPYQRNEKGVFVFDCMVPEGIREMRYRIVVDGQWMSDPSNPLSESDVFGNRISLFAIERELSRPPSNPSVTADGRLAFEYRGQAGKRVSLAGDFNGWDPFINFLEEISPGIYRISIRATPGRHFYYFFCDGRRILDRFNPENASDPDGNTVNSFFFLQS